MDGRGVQREMAAICVKGNSFKDQGFPGHDQAVPVTNFMSLAAMSNAHFPSTLFAVLFGTICMAFYRLAAFCCLQRSISVRFCDSTCPVYLFM